MTDAYLRRPEDASTHSLDVDLRYRVVAADRGVDLIILLLAIIMLNLPTYLRERVVAADPFPGEGRHRPSALPSPFLCWQCLYAQALFPALAATQPISHRAAACAPAPTARSRSRSRSSSCSCSCSRSGSRSRSPSQVQSRQRGRSRTAGRRSSPPASAPPTGGGARRPAV
jgi:hypothetical protein